MKQIRKDERSRGEGGGRVSFHFKFRQDFFLSTTMLRYVALKCCDRLAGVLTYSLDSICIAFAVVSVPVQGIFPVLMKKHLC